MFSGNYAAVKQDSKLWEVLFYIMIFLKDDFF